MLKVLVFYLEKQIIPKNNFLGRCQYQNKKALFTDPIFSEGFGNIILENILKYRFLKNESSNLR